LSRTKTSRIHKSGKEKSPEGSLPGLPTSLAEIISTSLLADTPRFPIRSRFEDGQTLTKVACHGYRAFPETVVGHFAEVHEIATGRCGTTQTTARESTSCQSATDVKA
jgi:hypothetical protein